MKVQNQVIVLLITFTLPHKHYQKIETLCLQYGIFASLNSKYFLFKYTKFGII